MKALDTRFYTGHNVYAATTVAFQQFELEQAELDSLAGLGARLSRELGAELARAGARSRVRCGRGRA